MAYHILSQGTYSFPILIILLTINLRSIFCIVFFPEYSTFFLNKRNYVGNNFSCFHNLNIQNNQTFTKIFFKYYKNFACGHAPYYTIWLYNEYLMAWAINDILYIYNCKFLSPFIYIIIITFKFEIYSILFIQVKLNMIEEQHQTDPKRILICRKVDELIQKNGQSQVFNRTLLRPTDIALKDYKTQGDQLRIGSLAYGLKLVLKSDMDSNKMTLADFPVWDFQVNENTTYESFQETLSDNLISVMKAKNQSRIKLAICICMYNEDKASLRRTLDGVKKNIAHFMRNGTSSDQIAVCVVMDGIQVVHPSVLSFFEELEMQSGIYLRGDIEQNSLNDLVTRQQEPEQDEVTNISHIIFGPEFEDRKRRQFTNRKAKYLEVKKMITRIEVLEKDKTINYQTIDEFIKPFFFDVARQKYKQEYALDDQTMKLKDNEFLRKQYGENINVSKPIIREALSLAKRHCNQYLIARENLALLNAYRVPIYIPPAQLQNLEQQPQVNAKMNLFFITKYKNRGKLTSHNWFFNGFCQQLNPQFAVLLDVGLAPQEDALFKMVRHMENDKKVGGVCGYMGLKIQRVDEQDQVKEENVDCITSLCMRFFDIQRAQQMQYHFAHLIDKPFESCFKFIHVLPGAFSAYRMKALKPGDLDSKVLRDYFESIKQQISQQTKKAEFTVPQTICKVVFPDFLYNVCFKPDQKSDQVLLYNQNVYLAEDRTLCLGIYANKYSLQYLPDAYAWVDPMKTLYGILGQRKRWINGSFFAFQKVNKQLKQNQYGTCFLTLQIFYLQIMNALAFVAPALFLFTIHIAMYAFYSDVLVGLIQDLTSIDDSIRNSVLIFVSTIDFIYILIFLTLIFYSMHLKSNQVQFQPFLYGVSTAYGIISIIVLAILAYDIISGLIGERSFLIDNQDFIKDLPGGAIMIDVLRYLILGIMCLYAIPIIFYLLMFCKGQIIVHLLMSAPAFVFYGATYLNILNIYALCRIDDISWGTKGLQAGVSSKIQKLAENWKKIRLIHVSKLVLWNSIIGFILLALGNDYVTRFYLTFVIMVILGFTMLIKVFLAVIYLIKYRCGVEKVGHTRTEFSDNVEECYRNISGLMKKQIKQQMFETGQALTKQNKNIKTKDIVLIFKPEVSKILAKNHRKKNESLWNSKISQFQSKGKKSKPSGISQNSINNQQKIKQLNNNPANYETSLDHLSPDRQERVISDTSSGKNIKLIPGQQKLPGDSKVKHRRKKGIL